MYLLILFHVIKSFDCRLAGVIARVPGHFVAISRRVTDKWEIHNDLDGKCRNCAASKKITPEGAIYVNTKFPEDNDFSSAKNHLHDILCDKVPQKSCKIPVVDDHKSQSSTATSGNVINEASKVPSQISDMIHPVFNTDKLWILRKENMRNLLLIDEKKFYLKNTSNFDAIVHLLMFHAQNNSQYFHLLSESSNVIFKFVLLALEFGPTDNLYQERAILLISRYASHIKLEVDQRTDLYILDLKESIHDTWKGLLKTEASGFMEHQCTKCGYYYEDVLTLTVNPWKIARLGFRELQKAINWHNTLYDVKCLKECCSGLCTITTSLNFHIYIEVCIRSSKNSLKDMECMLSDFPATLNLNVEYGYVLYHQNFHHSYTFIRH